MRKAGTKSCNSPTTISWQHLTCVRYVRGTGDLRLGCISVLQTYQQRRGQWWWRFWWMINVIIVVVRCTPQVFHLCLIVGGRLYLDDWLGWTKGPAEIIERIVAFQHTFDLCTQLNVLCARRSRRVGVLHSTVDDDVLGRSVGLTRLKEWLWQRRRLFFWQSKIMIESPCNRDCVRYTCTLRITRGRTHEAGLSGDRNCVLDNHVIASPHTLDILGNHDSHTPES